MLVDKTIPGLYNGVSQQAKEFVRDTQCLAQENAYGTIIGGLRKRPPLQFVQKDEDLSEDLVNAYYHTYDRGRIGTSTTSDAYISVVTANGSVRVWDAAGTEYVVKMYTDTAKTVLLGAGVPHPYLGIAAGLDASDAFRATTVADGTFIVNTSKETAYTADISQGTAHNYWTYWIKKTFYVSTGKGYDYTVNTTTVNSDSSAVAVTALDTALGSAFSANNPFLVYNANTTTAHTGIDSAGGSATSSWLKEVTSISQLPAGAVPTTPATYDPVVRVQGIDKGDDNYYYVKRDGEAWRETLGFDDTLTSPNDGLKYKLDVTTMPHILNKVGNEFHFYPADWSDRIVGDETITPSPSFIGQTIADVFMFNDRLGFVAGDSIVLSETSNYVNFWATTARSYPDTDPIDLKIDSTQVLYIDYAVAYAKELMLFTKEGQYVLQGSNGTVTPATVHISKVTSYPFSSTARPLPLDDMILFSSTLGASSSIYEYNVKNLGSTYEGELITDHVPSYLPAEIHKIVGISSVGSVFALPHAHNNELFVYNYYKDAKGQKAQSAWSKWTFNGDILDIFTLDNYLFISKYYVSCGHTDYAEVGTTTTAEYVPQEYICDTLTDKVYECELTAPIGTLLTNTTYFTDISTRKVLCRVDMSLVADPLTIDYRDEVEAGEYVDYNFYYKFKQWHMDATESGVDNRRGRLVVRSLLFNYNEGSDFEVTLTRGASSKVLGTQEIKDGKILVGSKSSEVDIEISNNTSVGLQLNTVSFEGTYYTRSKNLKGR